MAAGDAASRTLVASLAEGGGSWAHSHGSPAASHNVESVITGPHMTTDSTPRHARHGDPAELVSFEDHRRDILDRLLPLDPVAVDLRDAHTCTLARDVVANGALPAFANSAMDGFAVRAADAGEDARLAVVGEVAAGGGELPNVGAGQAVRIMTGAPLPPGADAVVPVEAADEEAGSVLVREGAQPSAHVRPAGEDVAAGDRILRGGRRLSAADVGMLAALGHGRVLVHRRPRVVVLSTGDELVEPGRPLEPGRIHDANSFTLTAMARNADAIADRRPIVPDEPQALRDAFEDACAEADLLVVSAGISAGRYDHVKGILAELGDVAFRKVAMKPGMPQAFGFLTPDPARPVPCFGLPGNPVSAAVSFEVLVRPAVHRLQGRSDGERLRLAVTALETIHSSAHKTEFVRVLLRHDDQGSLGVRPAGAQGSGILRSMVDADGLGVIPAGCSRIDAGQPLAVDLTRE